MVNEQNNLIRSLMDFFFILRDKYGFIVDISEAQTALTAVQDYTNVEDVLYSTQSAICKTKEQSEIYEALFAQTFLGYTDQEISKPSKQNELEKEFKNKIPPLNPFVSYSHLLSQKQELDKQIQDLQDKQDSDKKEFQKYKDETDELKDKLNNLYEQQNSEIACAKRVRARLAIAKAYSDDKNAAVVSKLKSELSSVSKSLGHLTAKTADEMKAIRAMKTLTDDIKESIKGIKRDVNCVSAGKSVQDPMNSNDFIPDMIERIITAALLFRDMNNSLYEHLINCGLCFRYLHADAEKQIQNVDVSNYDFAKREAEFARTLNEISEELKKLRSKTLSANKAVKENDDAITERRTALKIVNREMESVKKYERYQEYQHTVVQKDKSIRSRDAFIGGHRSVMSSNTVSELLNEPLSSMSASTMNKISAYIRTNAYMFKQSLRKKQKTEFHKKVDIAETIKNSMKTDGDIAKICYNKPKRSKAKIVLLADISGSCRSAASLSLYYLGLMGEVFPGGCHQFVFVNRLRNVDEYFKTLTTDDAVQQINRDIPTKGIYSDYGTPIKGLVDDYASYINKETTLIIIGDARSNCLDPHEDELRWLADHCHAAYLLNPDQRENWDEGDSIVSTYRDCGFSVKELKNTTDLISFLENAAK